MKLIYPDRNVPRDDYERAFSDLRARCEAARSRNQVLVVDDDAVVAVTLREILRRRCPNAAVTSMTDPEAALHAITTGAWAVVIADVHLKSKITGGTLVEATPRTTDVFFFTAHDDDLREEEEALRVSATLRKPLSEADEQRLVDLINKRTRERGADSDAPCMSPVPSAMGRESEVPGPLNAA